jgi:hypothetical protein
MKILLITKNGDEIVFRNPELEDMNYNYQGYLNENVERLQFTGGYTVLALIPEFDNYEVSDELFYQNIELIIQELKKTHNLEFDIESFKFASPDVAIFVSDGEWSWET